MLVLSNHLSNPPPTVVICRGVREEQTQLKTKLAAAAQSLVELLEAIKHDNTASCDRPESKE